MKYGIAICISVAQISSTYAQEKIVESWPEHLLYIYSGNKISNENTGTLDQLWAEKRKWKSGQVLRICFFGGDNSVRALIGRTAVEWTRYANLKFDFGPEGGIDCDSSSSGFSHVRIGFSERGYWSAVGKDSQSALNNLQPSMNFQQFDQKYNEINYPVNSVLSQADPEDKGTILHEFGHAIGLLHEHQNPAMNCQNEIIWTGPNSVYIYLSKPPNNWNKSKVDRNLGLISVTDPDYKVGTPDPTSIMMYSLDPGIFVNGAISPCYVQPNNKISSKDKEIVGKLYPKLVANIDDAQKSDLLISEDNFAASPVKNSTAIAKDYKERIVNDLSSDDTHTRRDARARLAQYFNDDAGQGDTLSIVNDMKNASYRYQLGVAVALGRTKINPDTMEQIKKPLNDVYKSNTDPTLKGAITKVIGSQ